MNEQHNKEDGLTICAVYHSPETRALLDMNVAFVKSMNPDGVIRWLVSDNSPHASQEVRREGVMTIIKGAATPIGVPAWAKGSYHHAAGVNLLLAHIRTRYALILDVDFFIVRSDWVKAIISRMKEKNLAFFGAPYHPQHDRKYRYFPCGHCLFIDGSKIDLAHLDFSPLVETDSSTSRLRRFITNNVFAIILGQRYFIGSTKDMGYKLYEQFFHDSAVTFESVLPVWEPRRSMVEWMLPERLCFVPKRNDSLSSHHFSHFGYTNLDQLGWEEYLWQDYPFGFHIRSGTNKMRGNTEEKMMQLGKILAEFEPPVG